MVCAVRAALADRAWRRARVGGEETARQEDDEEHTRPLPILCTPVCLPPEPRHSKSRSPQSTVTDLIARLDYFSSDKHSLRDFPRVFK